MERCGKSSFGGQDPAPGKTKHCQCRNSKMPSDYVPKSAAATIEDTIVFSHSMGNLILAAAMKNKMCKFGSGSSRYTVAGPMAGNRVPSLARQCCSRAVASQGFDTVNKLLYTMADKACDHDELTSAVRTLADDYTSWDGQN